MQTMKRMKVATTMSSKSLAIPLVCSEPMDRGCGGGGGGGGRSWPLGRLLPAPSQSLSRSPHRSGSLPALAARQRRFTACRCTCCCAVLPQDAARFWQELVFLDPGRLAGEDLLIPEDQTVKPLRSDVLGIPTVLWLYGADAAGNRLCRRNRCAAVCDMVRQAMLTASRAAGQAQPLEERVRPRRRALDFSRCSAFLESWLPRSGRPTRGSTSGTGGPTRKTIGSLVQRAAQAGNISLGR